jgi:hypothetical protein
MHDGLFVMKRNIPDLVWALGMEHVALLHSPSRASRRPEAVSRNFSLQYITASASAAL